MKLIAACHMYYKDAGIERGVDYGNIGTRYKIMEIWCAAAHFHFRPPYITLSE
jgi:hypothetical protein